VDNTARKIDQEFEDLELDYAFHRASGDAVCSTCQRPYRSHVQDFAKLGYDGQPFLRVLCSGMRVKL
jgi:hypothetical protein